MGLQGKGWLRWQNTISAIVILGQIFKTGASGFRLGAITVRLQPVDVAAADPAGAKVSVQILKVSGEPVVNQNGTTRSAAPNGVSISKNGDEKGSEVSPMPSGERMPLTTPGTQMT